jgi:hypothetical protein
MFRPAGMIRARPENAMHIRALLIVVVLFAAAAMATYLIRMEPPTQIGVSLAQRDQSHAYHTSVSLTFKEFHPAGSLFTGSVVIEMYPATDQSKPEAKRLLLRFDRFEEPNSLIYQGSSDEPIVIGSRPAWASFMGKGTFSWAGNARSGPFFYPFDRYELAINPSLLQVSDENYYPIIPIDTLATDFGNSNFIPRLENLHQHAPHDLYRITLERPTLLHVLAIIVAGLLVVWLIYLIWSAKPEEYTGNIVTLFVGVFSIRTSLLSGAPVFPSFIDYCALGIYLSAALIILIKWIFPGTISKECVFCKSSIPLAATVCPQCTQVLGSGVGR